MDVPWYFTVCMKVLSNGNTKELYERVDEILSVKRAKIQNYKNLIRVHAES